MRHLMSPLDLSVDELNTLLDLASDIEKHPDKYAHVCDDKRLATLFYEPSTRTRLIHYREILRQELFLGMITLCLENGIRQKLKVWKAILKSRKSIWKISLKINCCAKNG